MSAEIELIRRIATEHREIHVRWKEFFEEKSELNDQYKYTAGNWDHQKACIDEYDQILAALDVLEAAEVKTMVESEVKR